MMKQFAKILDVADTQAEGFFSCVSPKDAA